jgi:hypothetical protein
MEVFEMITRGQNAIFRPLVLFILTVLLVSQSVTCVLYEDTRGRYSIRFPVGWTQDSIEGADVVYVDPTADDFRENINILTIVDSSAKNTESYTLNLGEKTLPVVKNQFDATVVSQPSTSMINDHWTVSYTIDFTFNDIPIRESQTLIVSQGYKRVFVITCTASQSSFDDYEDQFNVAISSFTILNEPSGESSSDELLIWIILGAVGGAAVAVAAVAVLYSRKAK